MKTLNIQTLSWGFVGGIRGSGQVGINRYLSIGLRDPRFWISSSSRNCSEGAKDCWEKGSMESSVPGLHCWDWGKIGCNVNNLSESSSFSWSWENSWDLGEWKDFDGPFWRDWRNGLFCWELMNELLGWELRMKLFCRESAST